MKSTNSKSQNGFSLVELMLSMAILGIAGAAIMNVEQTQYKLTKSMNEKLVALNLKKILIKGLSNSEACNNLVRGKNINPTSVSPANPAQIDFDNSPLYMNGKDGSHYAKTGERVSSSSNTTVIVSSIKINITSGLG